MKLFIRLAVIAIVIAAGYFAWQYYTTPAPAAEPRTAPVTRGAIEQTVLATGVLEASSLVNVGAEVSGRINTLHVSLGQKVEAGDLIAEIDSLTQENAVRAAEAALASAEAQMRIQQANARQAEQSLTRARQLRDQNLISAADLETAEIAAEVAQAQLDQFEAQILEARISVSTANLDLDRTRITAPSAGTVVSVLAEEGQTLSANSEVPTIVKIANLETMIVKAEISEADVPRVAPGQRVYFTILGQPDEPIGSVLDDVEPAPDSIDSDTSSASSAVYYNGRFRVDNPDNLLRIAMTAQVTIILAEAEDALIVSAAAITANSRGEDTVMVYDRASGEIEPRVVTVGLNNNITAEIVDGLAEGELIVESGAGMAGAAGGPRMRGGPMGMF